jgi:IS30 family transposase
MLVNVDGKDTQTVVEALTKKIRRLPAELRKSLTWDRGLEMAAHKEFSIATDVKVYFCDPQSPWQRGTNENTNRLLRQYFPKGTNLSAYSKADPN